jgi:hypothetical protein
VRVSGVESRVHAAEVSHDPSAGTTVLRDAEFLIDGIRITTPEATVTSTAEGDSILTMKTATIVTDQ